MISFSLTTPQFRDGTKDVTRRLGWTFLKAGDRLRAVVKAMGLKKGEHPVELGIIEVVSVRREVLREISLEDVRREGFGHLARQTAQYDFVVMFCEHMRCQPTDYVTRIEFKRVH